MSLSAVTASFIGANGSRTEPSNSEFSSGCSAPSEVLSKGMRVKSTLFG